MLRNTPESHNQCSDNLRDSVTARLCYCGRAAKKSQFFCSDECRFWAKVNKGPDCWLWTASRFKLSERLKQGRRNTFLYGQFTLTLDGVQQHIGAHVYSFQLAYGPVPDGMEVMHSCHNMVCVNPAHLSAGTHTENVRQSARAGHYNVSRPTRQKLSPADIDEIRRLVASGQLQKTVAQKFGITAASVSQFISGKRRQYDAPISSPSVEELAS